MLFFYQRNKNNNSCPNLQLIKQLKGGNALSLYQISCQTVEESVRAVCCECMYVAWCAVVLVLQRLPAVLSRIGLIMATPLVRLLYRSLLLTAFSPPLFRLSSASCLQAFLAVCCIAMCLLLLSLYYLKLCYRNKSKTALCWR